MELGYHFADAHIGAWHFFVEFLPTESAIKVVALDGSVPHMFELTNGLGVLLQEERKTYKSFLEFTLKARHPSTGELVDEMTIHRQLREGVLGADDDFALWCAPDQRESSVVSVDQRGRRSSMASPWNIPRDKLDFGMKIGQGGFGSVYKGTYKFGRRRAVAIKKIKLMVSKQEQGYEQASVYRYIPR